MHEFMAIQGRDLFELLKRRGTNLGFGAEDPEGCAYDLMEIAETTLKIFNELIPAVLAARDEEFDVLQERWQDIYQEFRHIDYHIHATIYPDYHLYAADPAEL